MTRHATHPAGSCTFCDRREAVRRDEERVRTELAHRIDTLSDTDVDSALRDAAERDPDLVNDILDQMKVPR